ncbi:MAG: sodium:alanine symporter family protein [Clostridiaceae bacterium]|nr:sodium:alanine symporter family protein [Clostridiaceae bacterium]
MEAFLNFIAVLTGWVWGPPMLILLVGGGLFFTFILKFFQFRYFGYILKQTAGSIFKKPEGEGTVTPFQAVTAALASTVGASNIIGVPAAIVFGGPGAIFWMWIIALVGMGSKFAETVLGVAYREQNEEGEWVGGPMYYIRKGLKCKWLAVFFSFGLMIELVPSVMVQSNSVAASASEAFGLSPMISGIIVAILVSLVVFGGIQRIGRVTEKLVPFMSMLYVGGALIIIFANISQVPAAFASIFTYAFTPHAAIGGAAGAALSTVVRWGVARGVYSNEAGMGTAPIAHSAAVTDHPVRQGFWGIFEVIFDTLVICTITALVILTTGTWVSEAGAANPNPSGLPAAAFGDMFGPAGGFIVTFSLLAFVVSTIIVVTFYGEKQAEFLFGAGFGKVMKVVYIISIVIGAVGGATFLWQFLDILLALIIVPNMIAIILLNKDVVRLTEEFFSSEKYYLKDIGKADSSHKN